MEFSSSDREPVKGVKPLGLTGMRLQALFLPMGVNTVPASPSLFMRKEDYDVDIY